MRKKILILFLCTLVHLSIFAKGLTNLPASGKEIVLMQGGNVIWHATDWTLEIDSLKYMDMRFFGSGGDDYFKVYTFRGTPMGTESKNAGSTTSWPELSVIDCENLTWIFR